MISKASVEKILFEYGKTNEDIHLAKTLIFVSENDNLFGRDNLSGHITGSAWILNENEDKALLIHHKKLSLWFQPGGHFDIGDTSIVSTSEREALEETGLVNVKLLSDKLFDLDVHLIPERKGVPKHYHYDFRFLFKTNDELFDADFTEVNDIKWILLTKILTDDTFASVVRMAKKSIARKK